MKNRMTVLMRWIEGLISRPTRVAGADEARRAALVLRACAYVRVGDLDEAEDFLESELLPAHDAARLNLLGAILEKRGRRAEARRSYGRAMRADRAFEAARQNIRRWFELETFGHTDLPLLLGDEQPRLWWLRRGAIARGTPSQRAQGLMAIGGTHHDN
jgi:tetratricopeptide (TPR) repeat protein